MPIRDVLDECSQKFDALTAQPEGYLSVQDALSDGARDLTKSLYDFAKAEESSCASSALPALIIRDFDEEQIWQEIELQNEETWTKTLARVSKLLTQRDRLEIPVRLGRVEETQNGAEDDVDDDDEDSEDDRNPVANRKRKLMKEKDEIVSKSFDDGGSKVKKKYKETVVDDKFFKLREMEAFLDAEDKNEMLKDRKSSKKKSKAESSDEDDEDEEDVDLFEGWESDEMEEEEDESDAKYMKYGDFFDEAPKEDKSERKSGSHKIISHEENEDDENDDYDDDDQSNEEEDQSDEDEDGSEVDLEDKSNGSKKRVSFNLPQPSSDDDDSDVGDEPESPSKEQNTPTEDLSEFQKRQERLKKKIGHLENNLLQEKAWPMKGEVDAAGRPQNSLLEEAVDFDVLSRPPPVITEETTVRLQDIIVRRIKDKAWDDVVRKEKAAPEVREYKKQLVLDQEKSKLSLAQVYEREFVAQLDALDPNAADVDKPDEEPEAHVDIRRSLSKLFDKLNALCNFHYTPRAAAPEVKIVSNLPAVTMEEVAPVATADATLLAPEEIRAKPRGDVIGKSERTDTDAKRERRQKKIKQRQREKERQKREKLVEKLRPGLGNKYSKEKMSKLLEKVTKDRNVDKMEVSNDKKSLTSSTAFFNKLQDEVSSTIKAKLKDTKNSKKQKYSAKALKL